MNAVVVLGASAKEIAALALEVQERQKVEDQKADRLVPVYKKGKVIIERR